MALTLDKICSGYGRLAVLHDVTMRVRPGQVVSLIGANGAGKTTTLRTIAGMVHAASGQIEFDGRSLIGLAPHEVVRRGVIHVPEGRELFGDLTVQENLFMGGFTTSKTARREDLDEVYTRFPDLASRRTQRAGTMSGGQQQMLVIGRALMSRPELLMLDEPSLGLAPKIVTQVFDVIKDIRERGITVLLVEQNASRALEISDYAYVLESGSITLEGEGASLLADPGVKRAYLGM